MYYQNYEDYIRSILGYPVVQNGYTDTYENLNVNTTSTTNMYQIPRYSDEIMNLYPEIYKILNPMICKICEANTKPIDSELIEKMTDEIYLNIESDPELAESDIVNVRVNLPKEGSKEKNSLNSSSASSLAKPKTTNTDHPSKRGRDNKINRTGNNYEKSSSEISKNREFTENKESRQNNRNNTLRDLIKIMILNQLLGRNVRSPQPNIRPPYQGGQIPNQPRPPYQNGQNPSRPPIMPRLYANQWF